MGGSVGFGVGWRVGSAVGCCVGDCDVGACEVGDLDVGAPEKGDDVGVVGALVVGALVGEKVNSCTTMGPVACNDAMNCVWYWTRKPWRSTCASATNSAGLVQLSVVAGSPGNWIVHAGASPNKVWHSVSAPGAAVRF